MKKLLIAIRNWFYLPDETSEYKGRSTLYSPGKMWILVIALSLCNLVFVGPVSAQDIWFDVDATITSCPVNLNPVQTSDGTVDAGVTFEDAGITVEWNFVTPAGAMTHTAVTPATGAGNYYWQILGEGMYAITIPASGGATISNDTEGFGWFSCDTTATLPWRGPVIGFRSANKNDLEIEDGTAGTNQDDFFDGTGLSVATFTTDGMTQANIETYSQTGAAAAITADAEIETIKDNVALVLADTGTDGVILKAAGLATDAVTEIWSIAMSDMIAGTPSATATAVIALNWIYESLINGYFSTPTEITLYKNDGTTPLVEATQSDDGTNYTREKYRAPD